MIVVGIPFLTGFLIINSGIHTTHVITVVVGIPFTTVVLGSQSKPIQLSNDTFRFGKHLDFAIHIELYNNCQAYNYLNLGIGLVKKHLYYL